MVVGFHHNQNRPLSDYHLLLRLLKDNYDEQIRPILIQMRLIHNRLDENFINFDLILLQLHTIRSVNNFYPFTSLIYLHKINLLTKVQINNNQSTTIIINQNLSYIIHSLFFNFIYQSYNFNFLIKQYEL